MHFCIYIYKLWLYFEIALPYFSTTYDLCSTVNGIRFLSNIWVTLISYKDTNNMDVVWTVKKKSLPLCSRNQLYTVTYFPSLRKKCYSYVPAMLPVCSPVCQSKGLHFITWNIWLIVMTLGMSVTALEATAHHNFQLPTINMASNRTKLSVRT
jgi:hypothetical protein